jgi:putative transposase
MKKLGLLLARHTGRRRPREHDGRVATIAPISAGARTRWSSPAISGEMIRDMMVHCVERRFGTVPAPHRVQWLTDNGSIFAAHKTIDLALALNLEPCFAPVESPESNGMAEAFVKTFKRDYVRVNPIPDAATALAQIDLWMEDYNTTHPHSQLGYRSPREYINAQFQPAACPV